MKNAFRFGSGLDGDATISGVTILSRDMYYRNLNVEASGSLSTAGYRIFVSETLSLNGVISRNGNNASGSNGGGPLGGATLGTGARGANGGTGAGGAGTGASSSLGGSGGAGGAGSGGAGGSAGTASVPTAANGGAQIWNSGSYAWNPNLPASATKFTGGAGGGAGGGSGTANGGGGASGAGLIHIYAAKIVRTVS